MGDAIVQEDTVCTFVAGEVQDGNAGCLRVRLLTNQAQTLVLQPSQLPRCDLVLLLGHGTYTTLWCGDMVRTDTESAMRVVELAGHSMRHNKDMRGELVH